MIRTCQGKHIKHPFPGPIEGFSETLRLRRWVTVSRVANLDPLKIGQRIKRDQTSICGNSK